MNNQKGGSKLSNLKIVMQPERGKCGEVVERVLKWPAFRKRKLCQLKCAYFKITADFQTGHRSNSRRLGPYNSRHQVKGGGGCSLSVYYENIIFFPLFWLDSANSLFQYLHWKSNNCIKGENPDILVIQSPEGSSPWRQCTEPVFLSCPFTQGHPSSWQRDLIAFDPIGANLKWLSY